MISKLWFFVPIFIAVGFFQDFLKVNINYYADTAGQISGFYQLSATERQKALENATPDFPFDYYYSHGKLDLLNRMSAQSIQFFKWTVALFFIALHLVLVLWAYRRLDWPSNRMRAAIVFYAVCMFISLFFLGLGKWVNMPAQGYAVARRLLGFLQSPMPLVLTLMAAWLYLKWNPENP